MTNDLVIQMQAWENVYDLILGESLILVTDQV